MTVIKSKAPEGMEELPELDAVIIGGSAGGMTGIMDEAQRLLKIGGRLVVTAVTMETGYTILHHVLQRIQAALMPHYTGKKTLLCPTSVAVHNHSNMSGTVR